MTTMPWNRALPACLLAAALAWTASPAAAQQARTASFELFGSYVHQYNFDDGAFGVRGGYRFTDRWAVEGSALRISEGGTEVWLGDVSAKMYLATAGRAELFALAGPGDIRTPGGFHELTVHFGLGAEVPLSEHTYLRPEARANWIAKELQVDPILDYSLGLGWRF